MAQHEADIPKYADAAERAMRTLWQGFIVDALIAIGVGVPLLMAENDVTSAVFWTGLGVLVVKSILVSAASYLARLKLRPTEPATQLG